MHAQVRHTKFSALSLPVSLALVLLAARVSNGQDWPQWRGPNRDAKASAFTPPKTWPSELKPKWKVTVGEGVSTPALEGNKLYVFSRQTGAEVARCLDADTGKELWTDKYDSLGATGPASGFSGPRSSPTLASGKLITLGVRGVLSCLDAAKGSVLWRKEDFKSAYPRFFVSSSPLVAGDLCIAQLGGGDQGLVAAFQLSDGKEKWKWSGESPAYASPILMTVDGAKLVVAMTETRIVALTLDSGKLVWETPFAVQGRGYNAATPIANGSTLIYTGSGRGVTAIKLAKKGDAFEATELWKNSDNGVMFNTPVLKDNLLFGLTAQNDFFCLDGSGKTAWTKPSAAANAGGSEGGRGRMGRGGYGSIVDAGPVLVALTPSSELIVFEPSAKSYTELARIKIADSPTYAYPVLSGKRCFIKDQDSVSLYSFE